MLIFTNQQCHIDNGVLRFPRIINMAVKTRVNSVELREVRIIPEGMGVNGNPNFHTSNLGKEVGNFTLPKMRKNQLPFTMGYNLEIVYEKDIFDRKNDKSQRIMGIDMGLRNIVTMGDSISKEGIAVKGGILLSINQFFNKEYARLKSISDRQNKDNRLTNREKRLFMKRNRKIKDLMHKLSKAVIKYAKSKNVDTIVIGHSDGWKQSVNIGKVNTQNFVQLPFNMLIDQIKYKAEEMGMKVIIEEESHTSKCSFLDKESIEHHDGYMEVRIKRGQFRTANGTLMHADLNAAYNIIRKAIPEAFANGIEGIGLYQRSLSVPEFTEMITSKY